MQWIQDITDFIFLSDPPVRSDIIFVPGNGHAEPSEYAAHLYHEAYAPLLLPSGRYSINNGIFSGQTSGSRIYTGSFRTEWDFMHAILLQNGVPDAYILREDQATYTYQNATLSRQVLEQNHIQIRSAILVCLPYHARRAKMYYSTVFPEISLSVCPVEKCEINRENWFQSEEGILKVLGELERCGSQFHDIAIALEKDAPLP